MSNRMKNLSIGLFILAAIGFTAIAILFIRPNVGDGEKELHLRLANITGLRVGTRVTLAGKAVGEISAIYEVENSREGPQDELGRAYFYELILKLDSSVNLYKSDEIKVYTTGLMGEKSIAIIPKATDKKIKLEKEEIVFGNSSDFLQNVASDISLTASSIKTATEDFNTWFKKNGENITSSINNFNETIKSLDLLLKGTGSISKFLKNDDFYFQVTTTMNKVNTLMNDINNYGLLFHYNKNWQRMRTKRACTLEKLSTSKEFTSYFEAEMDSITASLGRLSTLMQKDKNREAFKKEYPFLLKEVETLLDSIKLYTKNL